MKRTQGFVIALIVLTASSSMGLAYTKPSTYRKYQTVCSGPSDTPICVEIPGAVIFQDQIAKSPHSWAIPKAIKLLSDDGYTSEAALAQKYLLPMLEGVTFNDVWGDADLGGGSILDYYVPGHPETGYGFGCAAGGAYAPYKNCTNTFTVTPEFGPPYTVVGFDTFPFYGYGNAAEEAQYRYDFGTRIYLGQWSQDPHAHQAGWVIDNFGITGPGQDDPFNGRWADGKDGIDNARSPTGKQSRFGDGIRPIDALEDLYFKYSMTQAITGESDETLSTLHVPTDTVIHHTPEWLDDTYNKADDVEAYMGWDGDDYVYYANWTDDTAGHCGGGTDCGAPMIVRFQKDSKAHAFFNLGWAIHLLEDNTTPVHTINESYSTATIHNNVETMADYAVQSARVNAGYVSDLIPTSTIDQFVATYDWPPTPGDHDCVGQSGGDPAFYFQPRWYAAGLQRDGGEGVAHAYTRNLANIASQFKDYVKCIDTVDDHNWPAMGYFTALGLDDAVKATAGLIRQFIEDVDKTAPALAITQPLATTYPHFGTLKLQYSDPTDDESGVQSFTATLDNQTSVNGQKVASGLVLNLLTDLKTGDHTLALTATDNAGNVASPSVTFSIVVTAASIMDEVNYFFSTHDITMSNEANSLLQKLRAGAAYRAAGDCARANEVYQSFIAECVAQAGKKVSAYAAGIMIADAQYLVAHCP